MTRRKGLKTLRAKAQNQMKWSSLDDPNEFNPPLFIDFHEGFHLLNWLSVSYSNPNFGFFFSNSSIFSTSNLNLFWLHLFHIRSIFIMNNFFSKFFFFFLYLSQLLIYIYIYMGSIWNFSEGQDLSIIIYILYIKFFN